MADAVYQAAIARRDLQRFRVTLARFVKTGSRVIRVLRRLEQRRDLRLRVAAGFAIQLGQRWR